MDEIILFGAGDFALEVVNILQDVNTATMFDEVSAPLKITDVISQTNQISDDLRETLKQSVSVHTSWDTVDKIGEKAVIICVGDSISRDRIYEQWECLTLKPELLSVVHPTAVICSGAEIGSGVIIAPFAYVGPKAIVGANALINVHASIGHHVVLGRSCVVSPHSALNGRASLERAVFIGSGAIIAPGKRVGSYSKISNGAVVSSSCGSGFLLAGNPAKGRQMFEIPENKTGLK